MNLFAHSISSKGGLAFARRLGTIARRFDLSAARTENALYEYLDTLAQFGTSASFPITAVVLRRHATLIRRLQEAGVEFAVHGLVHTDHGRLSAEQQWDQIKRALDIFRAEKIAALGFRGPYLRYNEATVAIVEQLGFQYISNQTFAHDVVDDAQLSKRAADGYRRAIHLYSALPAAEATVRPWMRGRLVEIPVALPDDEILVDRLGITSGNVLGANWVRLLEATHERGDLLTLQLHPERGALCREGLAILLRAARQKQPAVWIAQLRDVADWWRRRQQFKLQVEPAGPGRWQVSTSADSDATVWARNLASDAAHSWYGPNSVIAGPQPALVDCPTRPVIGVSPRSEATYRFLSEEGPAVEYAAEPSDYSLWLDRPGGLSPPEQAALLREIERSPAPLIGIGRWPQRARSALSVTGDIDALTLLDFIYRVWEVR
jgi:peptidoglycan/xylan/chitin deacetylase (PgdA/CDA1 family)